MIFLLIACGAGPDEPVRATSDEKLMCRLEKEPELCYRVAKLAIREGGDLKTASRALRTACESDHADSCLLLAEVSTKSSETWLLSNLSATCLRGVNSACKAFMTATDPTDRQEHLMQLPEDKKKQILERAASMAPAP